MPGFQDGGAVGIPTTNVINQQAGLDAEAFADVLAERINDIKIVAIEEEITDAQAIKANIVEGANI